MSQQLHIVGELCTFLLSDAKDGNLHEFLNSKRGLTEKLNLAFSVPHFLPQYFQSVFLSKLFDSVKDVIVAS